MFLDRIQIRLTVLVALLIALILGVGGWTLDWIVRQSLETELANKLVAVARAASMMFDEEQVTFVFQGFGPRVEKQFRDRLAAFQKATGANRITVLDPEGRALLDTEESQPGVFPHFQTFLYRKAAETLRSGQPTSSILFEDIDGRPAMIGFAPLLAGGRTVGGIGVEGSVTFLDSMRILRWRLVGIGLAGFLLAVAAGALMARSITRPVGQLVHVSQKIGEGDYTTPIPGRPRGEIGFLTRAMETMRQGIVVREQELKTMLAGVAHEIRNPLGGIELFSGLLLDETSPRSKARTHVQRIQKETAHLKYIVDRFLTFARPHPPNPSECRISDLVEEIRLLLGPKLTQERIVLQIQDSGEAAAWIDPSHGRQIFLNLVLNAAAAMSEGGIVRIGLVRNGDFLDVSVRDTGTGIPEDIRPSIFTPFFTTREEGTGLGLSIVKSLVEANSGSIRLAATFSQGTEFVISLPRPPRSCGSQGPETHGEPVTHD